MKHLPLRAFAALALTAGWTAPTWGETGYTSANFLKVGMGARPAAMADAFTAVSDDTTAVYWNPAGLALTRGFGLSATHGEWLQGVQNDFLAVSDNLGPAGTVGLSFTTEQTSAFLSTLETSSGAFGGNGAQVSALDGEVSAAYALPVLSLTGDGLFKGTYAGLKADMVFQGANGSLGNSLSFDLGLLQKLDVLPLTLGLALQNLGTSIQDRSLPLLVNAGAAWRFDGIFSHGDWATLAAEADFQSDSYVKPSAGLEYRRLFGSTLVSLRAGARTTDDLQGFSALTAGAGLQQSFDGLTASLDYALAPYGVLGVTHRVTLNLNFLGGPMPLEAGLKGPAEFTTGNGKVPMDLSAGGGGEVKAWSLVFTGPDGKILRQVQGRGLPPSRYDWDGRDAQGQPLGAGACQAQLTLKDPEGRETRSSALNLRALAAAPPEVWSLSGDALFETGKARLNATGLGALSKAARQILEHPEKFIEIGGHTDNAPLRAGGSFKDNQELSEARAQSVKEFLVSQGVAENHLKTAGYADRDPVASNDTPEGRAKNRRVEFKVLDTVLSSQVPIPKP